jgi:membrane protein
MNGLLGTPKAVISHAIADNITGEAAKATYYLFFSIFPLIIAAFAFAGLVGGEASFAWIMERVETLAPGQGGEALLGFVEETMQQRRPGLLSLGVLLTVWAASNFFAALGEGLDAMWDVERKASFLKRRGKALLMLLVGGVLLVAGAGVIMLGPLLVERIGVSGVVSALRWPLGFLLITALMWLMYYILPNRDQSNARRELAWGAVVGTALWMAGTGAFSYYTNNIGDYDATYGAFGGVIVLMLWLFVTSLSVLFGGEVAHVLEKRRRGER